MFTFSSCCSESVFVANQTVKSFYLIVCQLLGSSLDVMRSPQPQVSLANRGGILKIHPSASRHKDDEHTEDVS